MCWWLRHTCIELGRSSGSSSRRMTGRHLLKEQLKFFIVSAKIAINQESKRAVLTSCACEVSVALEGITVCAKCWASEIGFKMRQELDFEIRVVEDVLGRESYHLSK